MLIVCCIVQVLATKYPHSKIACAALLAVCDPDCLHSLTWRWTESFCEEMLVCNGADRTTKFDAGQPMCEHDGEASSQYRVGMCGRRLFNRSICRSFVKEVMVVDSSAVSGSNNRYMQVNIARLIINCGDLFD